jgi:hypothetical protein
VRTTWNTSNKLKLQELKKLRFHEVLLFNQALEGITLSMACFVFSVHLLLIFLFIIYLFDCLLSAHNFCQWHIWSLLFICCLFSYLQFVCLIVYLLHITFSILLPYKVNIFGSISQILEAPTEEVILLENLG